ncbi:MAG: hypothetical protein QNJ78_14355 [Gammaproteobacteria bacterium]|nr:hypothetical protein [Gammaproteobacteria bacterium]
MLVFIRLLPESVTQNELRKFVDRAIHSPWSNLFFRSSKIHTAEIRKISSSTNHSVEYHGIVDIEPAKAAVKAIQKLNRTVLRGKEVEVRKYYQRSELRDRRTGTEDALPFEERRKQDRRREAMVAERVLISGRLEPGYSKSA